MLPRLRTHPDIDFLGSAQDHRLALAWIGATTAFGSVVKNRNMSARIEIEPSVRFMIGRSRSWARH
jgi:hypothetical protein